MNVTFIARELRAALAACRGIIERRNTIPILSCVRITATGAAAIVEVTNLDQRLAWTAPCTGEGQFLLPYWPLARLVAGVAAGEMIRIGPAPDDRIRVDMPDARASFMGFAAPDWPDACRAVANDAAVTIASTVLKDLMPFISAEETRYYLCGVCLEPDNDSFSAVATNGHQLGLIERAGTGTIKGSVIIPRAAASWLGSRGVDLTLAISGLAATFRSEQFELTTKLIDGTYPAYRRVIPSAGVTPMMTADALALARLLDRCRSLGNRVPYACLAHQRGRLVASIRGAERELLSIALPGTAPKDFDIGVRADLLADILRFAGPGDIVIGWTDAEAPLLLRRDDRLAVLMPCRVQERFHDLPEDLAA